MLDGNVVWLRDCSEVHFFVPLHQQLGILIQLLGKLRRKRQALGGADGFQVGFIDHGGFLHSVPAR